MLRNFTPVQSPQLQAAKAKKINPRVTIARSSAVAAIMVNEASALHGGNKAPLEVADRGMDIQGLRSSFSTF